MKHIVTTYCNTSPSKYTKSSLNTKSDFAFDQTSKQYKILHALVVETKSTNTSDRPRAAVLNYIANNN